MNDTPEPSEIRLHRLYDAPLQAVWDAWTDPAQTAQWWGPRGFTLTTHSKDLRPGGRWIYTMHGPDGTDHPNSTLYLEVEPLSRLVYDHGASGDRPPMFRVTVEFAQVDGKTRMDMSMRLPTAEAASQTRQFIKQAGGNATWDRLAEFVAKRLSDREKFVINRSFDAPREVVFAMWTDPAHLVRWLAPTGFTMHFNRADIRSGGSSFFTMTGPGVLMHAKAEYEEVRSPDLLVYTQQFCDEKENTGRHPLAPAWPETMRTSVEFTVEGNGTRVTVTSEVIGPVTADEMAVFSEGRTGMTYGWTGSLDKLEAVLAAG